MRPSLVQVHPHLGLEVTEVARRRLNRRRDGLAPTTNEISARIRAYRHMFRIDGYTVRLRRPPDLRGVEGIDAPDPSEQWD